MTCYQILTLKVSTNVCTCIKYTKFYINRTSQICSFFFLQEFEQADIVWVVANAERARANETSHVSLYKIMKSSIFIYLLYFGENAFTNANS